jgi:PIN domain nuclease of toxin-antitoxin system
LRRLLDTHIAIWAVTLDARLPEETRATIRDPSVEVFVSLASLWEIAIKNAFSKPRRGSTFPSTSQAADWFRQTGLEILPIKESHILALESLPLIHGDPFDRLLVAQAISEPMILITHDRRLSAYSDLVSVV